MTTRKPYPSDVSDEEWAFVAQYLALVQEEAPQRRHSLREVFNGLRWMSRSRRLARDYERLPETWAGLHFVAFACLLLHRAAGFVTSLGQVHNTLLGRGTEGKVS